MIYCILMESETETESQLPKNKMLRVLKLLWEKFLEQPIYTKWITLLIMGLTLIIILVFFSTFVIWKICTILFVNVFLTIIDWYLMLGKKKKME